MDFATNKTWADTFLDQQINILNSYLPVLDFNKIKKRDVRIDPAPQFDDQHLATDVLMFGTLRIALRVRAGKSSTFRDIALRSHLRSGAATEIHKIRKGYGDYYLYCWTADGKLITEWILIDLDKFREALEYGLEGDCHINPDGSAFNTYDIAELVNYGCCVDSFLNVLV